MSSNSVRKSIVLSVIVTSLFSIMASSASAGFIEKRYGNGYYVTPAMMHAIEVIISEHSKMMRRHKGHP